MDIQVRIGIIGTGGIANAKHMPSLARLPQTEMVAFCDIIEERARNAAAQFGSFAPDVYTDYRELLKDPSIDVVHICTPNSSHAEITVAALEAGKHVMCEKPMAITTGDARLMLEAAKRTGKKLTIGYNYRYRPDSLHLKKLIEQGELGEIYYGKALAMRRRGVPTWGVFLDKELQGGGPLIDIGTHALDMTLWMMNNYKPVSVSGSVFHKLGSRENAANLWGPWDPGKFTVEDSAFGFIKMENGATISLECSWALNTLEAREAKTLLCGTEGGADMHDGLRINGEKFSKLYETRVAAGGDSVAFFDGQRSESPADLEARLWIECILNDTEPFVKPEEALVVSRILEAIYQSAASGETVYFTHDS
ncbi:Gfo/Idh/MocA family protein [Paenibacillus sp. S150]|uniref:Gfo/Idh/MocA family protein n=1 Tax=Paenibacillus sp. S150 TaxID=2749826 RepID=UPI001C57C4BF|nr:Gfo/Idh/MocA family oxidoreductase [Paenibacillus sp. S150]MBW4079813.1 Gfo/Idh/MocA family oxidoreductase [Paenibacillus sp. S150]